MGEERWAVISLFEDIGMDEERAALGLPQCVGDRRRWGSVTVAVVKALLARTAAGESLRSICRDPAMPSTRTVCQWARERPPFAARLLEARRAAGGPFTGARTTYCEATAQRIFDRVAGGESLAGVCRDADMPVMATVYNWRAARPEFGRALTLAMAVRAEELTEAGWEMCQAVTPETAIAARVQLWHLRWHVGKLAPKKYGLPMQMEGGLNGELAKARLDDAALDREPLQVIVKRFCDVTEEEQAQAEETERRFEARDRRRGR